MATLSSDNGRVVFIDTNLDTHLALIVSDHDTVSDLKKNILSEHPACFPKIGQIQINGIKVKRKGYFYHLSDSMLVRSAFSPFNKSWFLSVDVSALGDCGQNEQLLSHGIANNNAVVGPHDNAISLPSNLQLLQLENKRDESEQIPVVSPCVSEHTAKEAVTNLEGGVKSTGDNGTGIPLPNSTPVTEDRSHVNQEVPSSRIECEVDGSGKGNKDDCNVCEEEPSISVASVKGKRKSKKRKKEDTGGGDNSKDNIASVDNPLSCPSERASSFNNFPVPQLENKQDGKEEIPFDGLCVSEHTEKAVKNVEMDVKSSGNNDRGVKFPSSIPETRDNSCVNHELPNSHIECEVDGSNKGTKDDCIKEGTSKPAPSAKKKHKSKKRKKEDTVRDSSSKENDASVAVPGDYTVQQDIVVLANSSENADKEVIKETEVLKEHQHTECNNNSTENDVVAVSMKEASEPRPAVNKKHKKRKTHHSEELLKVETASQKDAAKMSHEAHEERKESKDQFELNDDKSGDGVEYKHDKTEDILDTRPPAKKRKGKEKSREKSLSNKKLANDLNGDNSSSHLLEDQQNIKNSNADQSAEHFNDADQLRTSVLDGRKKGKMNSSYLHESPVVTSTTREDEEANHSSIQREGIQEEISKDACKESIQSTVESIQSHEAHEERKESKDQFELNDDKSGDGVEYKHDKTEDILDTRPPAKKRKGKEKSREKSLSNKKLANDLNGDNSSSHLLEDQQNIKNSNADQSAEHFNDADQLRTSVLDGRKKGKMNSSDLHESPVVTSTTREDEEANHSSIQRQGIQEEISKDACNESIQSTVERKGSNKNHCDIEMKVQPSDVNEPKNVTEDNENVVLGHRHESEAGQTEGAEEGKEVSPQNDPKLIPLETRTPSNQDNTNSDIRELKTTSNVVDVNGMNGPVKSEKRKRGTKKAKNSGGGLALKEDIGPVDASKSETVAAKSLKATIRDPIPGNTETEENPLNQTEGKKIQQEEMQGTVLSVTDKGDDLSADNSGQQIKTKSNAENVDGHVDKSPRKKLNNKQASTSKSTTMLTKDQVLDSKKERDVHRIHPGKKVPNAPKTVQDSKLPSRSDSAMSSIEENRKPRNNASGKSMDLERRGEHIPISKSKLEGSNKMVQNKARKASRNTVGGVVSKAQQKKSLLEGAIFDDNSSGTSEGEDQVDNSDASTRTPSDNSLLSDFSDGDNSPGLDSQQNGSHGGKRLENGERSSSKASLSGTKGMPIDRVLRSSTRYKKAKITASQMDESESQPEFVPDSLPC